jgi:two-component system capsular synthesis sensor histidine kinase RcsC
VESEWGAGATFRAQIRAVACAVPAEERRSSASPLALAGRRVLVADDNELVRQFFVETLREVGALCTPAADGESALAAATTEKFDAVLLDFAMPRLDGVETVRRLRATHGAALRIVGVSAHAGDAEREAALAAGMDAFLVKPVSTADLVGALAPLVQTDVMVQTEETIARLRLQFRDLAAAESVALASAVAAQDFAVARTRAHHLMNSATAVRDDWLFTASAAVERAAIAKDGVALAVAWEACESALQPWLTKGAMISEILSANDQ